LAVLLAILPAAFGQNYNIGNTSNVMKTGFGTGVPTATCAVGMQYFQTDAAAGSNVWLCTSTNVWTRAGQAATDIIVLRTLCQNTIGGPNFSTPAANPPAFNCVTGGNAGDVSAAATAWNFGVLSFAENASEATSQSVQGMIPLAPTWSAAAGIPAGLTWRTAPVVGDSLWRIQGQCIADGEVPGNFSAAVDFTADTAKGTTLQWNDTATLTLTTGDALAGCAAGETFLFRLWRDATQGGDTLAGAAELISARFTLTR
jgi:hypothetical protein